MEARRAEKVVGLEGRTIGFSQCLPIVSLVTVSTTQGSDYQCPASVQTETLWRKILLVLELSGLFRFERAVYNHVVSYRQHCQSWYILMAGVCLRGRRVRFGCAGWGTVFLKATSSVCPVFGSLCSSASSSLLALNFGKHICNNPLCFGTDPPPPLHFVLYVVRYLLFFSSPPLLSLRESWLCFDHRF